MGAKNNAIIKTTNWQKPTKIIPFHIKRAIIISNFLFGGLYNKASAGGSVASAYAENESMITFNQSIWIGLIGDSSRNSPPTIAVAIATMLIVYWNCTNFLMGLNLKK